MDYGKNPVKTENGDYVCSYACDPRTIDAQFVLQKEKYNALTGRVQNRENNVLVYQIRQSFKPGEISPEDANRIGYDLAMRWTKGKHAFMVATHTDKAHIHNHIYYNSTTLDCTRKYVDFFFSGKALHKLSDQICLENGLSIIENPKRKGKHYVTWLGDAKEPSYLEKLRQAIDATLAEKPDDFNAFLSLMVDAGYEIKQGVHLSFKAPGQTRPTRLRSLKDDNYTEDAIRERISGARIINDSGSDAVFSQPVRLNLLIDLQNSIKVKNSPGYERWAKVFNLKQLAQTFNFLQENNLTDYEVLKEKTEHAISNFNQLSDKIKKTEKRMNEVSDLQKHISNYSRTRDVFIQYRKSGYNKNFYAEHEQEIILQKAAKQAFDKQNLKKLPTIKMLRQEYAALLAEKKTLYQSYRSARDEMKKYTTAKANADQLLNYSSQQVQEDIRGKVR
ncbi:MAG: relaxase/mobilization nuclease domain-containing protein [Lachnospiraceae bacterium]